MFYEQMAAHYQWIFPAMPKVPFLLKHFAHHPLLLDIGCSDGRVAQGLNEKGHSVIGIDLSETMIQVAKTLPSTSALHFLQLDMLKTPDHFGGESADGIYCIGNTFVHLPDLTAMEEAISGFYKTLKPGGRLIVQILNYAWYLDNRPRNLPLIDNEIVRFERFYSYLWGGPDATCTGVDFSTTLTIKATGEMYSGTTRLFPLEKKDLEALALKVGFEALEWYGDYTGAGYSPNSTTLLLVADKPSSTIIKNPEK